MITEPWSGDAGETPVINPADVEKQLRELSNRIAWA